MEFNCKNQFNIEMSTNQMDTRSDSTFTKIVHYRVIEGTDFFAVDELFSALKYPHRSVFQIDIEYCVLMHSSVPESKVNVFEWFRNQNGKIRKF